MIKSEIPKYNETFNPILDILKKFRWLDEDNNDTDYFFELKIVEDEITKDVSLVVVDYAVEAEVKEASQLWENQISDLKHVIGSV